MAADVFLRHSVSHWSVRDIAKFVSSIARGASCSFRSRSQAFCQCLWGIEVVEILPAPYGSYHRFWMRWSFALRRRAQCTSSIPFRIFIVFWYICFLFSYTLEHQMWAGSVDTVNTRVYLPISKRSFLESWRKYRRRSSRFSAYECR